MRHFQELAFILFPIFSVIIFIIGIIKTIRCNVANSEKRKSYFVLIGGVLIFISLTFINSSIMDYWIVAILMLSTTILSFLASNKILRKGK
jgi:hypothetical protein